MAEKKFDKVKYDNQYRAEHFERIDILFAKGTKEKIKTASEALGIGISEFVRQAVDEKINNTK